MAVVVTNLVCELQEAVKVRYLDGNLFSLDNQGNQINVEVLDGGDPATISGSVSANVIRSDGGTVAVSTGSISDNVVSVILPQAAYAIPGVVSIVIKLTASGVVTTIAAIVANVYQSSTDTVVDPGTIIPSVQTLISAIETAVASIPADYSSLWTSLAPAFNSSTNYVAGQYVTNNGGLYRFKKAHSGEWSSSDVVATNLGGDISDLKSAIDIIDGDDHFDWKDGKYINTNGTETTSSNYSYTKTFIPVIPGSKIIICTKINGSAAIAVYRSDMSTVDAAYTKTSESGGILYRYVITLSENAAYVRFSCGTADKGNAYIIKEKQDKLTFDTTPKANSSNPVESNGIFSLTDALGKFDGIEIITEYKEKYGYNTTGASINVNSPTSNDLLSCVYAECSAGDKFTYTGKGSSSYKQYAFLNSEGTILEIGTTEYVTNLVITAPTNSAYVVFNFLNNYGRAVWKGAKDRTGLVEITNFHNQYGYKTTGSTIDINNPTANSSVDCAFVSCKKGDQFTYSGKGSTSYKSYAFIDISGNVLYVEPTTDSLRNRVIIAPENAAYVIFNYIRANAHAVYIGADSEKSIFNFYGANVAIIGDSISTNGDYSASNPFGNVPEIVIQDEDVGVELSAYVTYYDIGKTVGGHEIVAADVGTEIIFTPVEGDIGKTVGKPKNNNAATVETWWEVARGILGFNPIPVCWSGSSITSHEGTDNEYKTSYAWHPAQIRKCGIRTPGTMTRTAPDMIIIYRGTNDFSHSPYSKLTEDYFNASWSYPDTDVITGGFGFKEGLCLTIRKLREAYPSAQIVLCTCNFFKRVNYSTYPINNGEYTENQLNDAIREVANWMGCKLIEFDKDGLTFENASSTYYQDSTAFTHPTTAGHKILGNRALRDMSMFNNMA